MLAAGLWIGLLTALGELTSLGIRVLFSASWIQLGIDVVWMTPLADATLAVAGTLLMLPVVRLAPRRGFRFVIGVLLFFAALSVLLNLPWIAPKAGLILALGIAVASSRLVSERRVGFESLVRRTLAPLTGVVLVLALGTLGGRAWLEQRRIDALPDAAKGAPNILLIILDTAGASWFSGYGYERTTTPHLDQFARSGAQFDWAMATSTWTLPSHASVFTGRYAHELSTTFLTPLDGAYPTLAEQLAKIGYATAGFAANQSYVTPEFGVARGFIHFEAFPATVREIAVSSSAIRWITDRFSVRRLLGDYDILTRVSADQINTQLLSWISAQPRRPFFAFLNYFDAHEPYRPPGPWDRKFGSGPLSPDSRTNHAFRAVLLFPGFRKQLTPAARQAQRDAYDGALAYLDSQIGALLSELDRQHLTDNTIVVVTADHGEGLGEANRFIHGEDLNTSDGRVPLMIRYPEKIPAGSRVPQPVSLRDLPATIAELAGISNGLGMPGQSLVPLLSDSGATASPAMSYLKYYDRALAPGYSLLVGRYHYIRDGYGCEFLYDVADDPLELKDLRSTLADSGRSDALRTQLDTLLGRDRPKRIPCRAASGNPNPSSGDSVGGLRGLPPGRD